MLVCNELEKRYRAPVLRGVTLSLQPGELALLLGCNGSGKTTLFKCLSGLERHRGSVLIDGTPAANGCPDLLTVFDDCPLDGALTGRANLELLLGIRWSARAASTAAAFLPASELGRRAGRYSYGQRKRLWLAAVALSPARHYLLDEAANGLDIEALERFRELLVDKRRTSAIVVTGHQPHAYDGLVDRLLVLRDGTIEEVADDRWRGRPLADAARDLALR